MLFELRQYTAHPGKRDELVALMENEVIPFQVSKGMSVVGSFVAEDDPNLFIWIRRFDSEEHREALYEAVYETDRWKNEFAPQVPDLIDKSLNSITRMNPTAISALH